MGLRTAIDLSTGTRVKTQTLIWAAGLLANPIVNSLGVELVHGGRIPEHAPGHFFVLNIPLLYADQDVLVFKRQLRSETVRQLLSEDS